LQPARNTVEHSLFRDFEPNRQIESGSQPRQDRHQTLGLGQGSRKTIKDEPVSSVQAQPIFNKFNDDFVRNQAAVLDDLSGLFSQRCPEIFFAP
jgi:hypothetical protein